MSLVLIANGLLLLNDVAAPEMQLLMKFRALHSHQCLLHFDRSASLLMQLLLKPRLTSVMP
jgi:hypothetical protein